MNTTKAQPERSRDKHIRIGMKCWRQARRIGSLTDETIGEVIERTVQQEWEKQETQALERAEP
jgi:hypothetical protein